MTERVVGLERAAIKHDCAGKLASQFSAERTQVWQCGRGLGGKAVGGGHRGFRVQAIAQILPQGAGGLVAAYLFLQGLQ